MILTFSVNIFSLPFFEGLKKKNVKSFLYTLLSSYSDKLWENFGFFHQVSTKLSAYLRYESSVLAQACMANDFGPIFSNFTHMCWKKFIERVNILVMYLSKISLWEQSYWIIRNIFLTKQEVHPLFEYVIAALWPFL